MARPAVARTISWTLPPRKLPLSDALREMCASRGVEFAFAQKYKEGANAEGGYPADCLIEGVDLTLVVIVGDKSYWPIRASAKGWRSQEEHDDMFYDAATAALDRWLADRAVGR